MASNMAILVDSFTGGELNNLGLALVYTMTLKSKFHPPFEQFRNLQWTLEGYNDP
jgi:hypothetical protein